MKFRNLMVIAAVTLLIGVIAATVLWGSIRKQQDYGPSANTLLQKEVVPATSNCDDCTNPPDNFPTAGVTVCLGSLPNGCLDSLGSPGIRQYPLDWDPTLCAYGTSFQGADGCTYYMLATWDVGLLGFGGWTVTVGCAGGGDCGSCQMQGTIPALFHSGAQPSWIIGSTSVVAFIGTNCSGCDGIQLSNVISRGYLSVSNNTSDTDKKALEKMAKNLFAKKPNTQEPPLAKKSKS